MIKFNANKETNKYDDDNDDKNVSEYSADRSVNRWTECPVS